MFGRQLYIRYLVKVGDGLNRKNCRTPNQDGDALPHPEDDLGGGELDYKPQVEMGNGEDMEIGFEDAPQ